jgi:hypothetical protein
MKELKTGWRYGTTTATHTAQYFTNLNTIWSQAISEGPLYHRLRHLRNFLATCSLNYSGLPTTVDVRNCKLNIQRKQPKKIIRG